MFNRILVAIDGSTMSKKALETALKFAKEKYSYIGVIHVEKNLTIAETIPNDSINEIFDSQQKERIQLLDQANALAEEEGLIIETIFSMGDPAIQIVKKAKEGNYQLIIIGSRGLGSIRGLMLGSVSQRVSQMAHCPVLIIK